MWFGFFNKRLGGVEVDVYFNLAKESEDITDAVLAVRGSLQNVGNALDDFVGGAKVLTVSPGL